MSKVTNSFFRKQEEKKKTSRIADAIQSENLRDIISSVSDGVKYDGVLDQEQLRTLHRIQAEKKRQ